MEVLDRNNLARYSRQVAFEPFGLDEQITITQGRVLIVSAGGLGTWVAELLVRSGGLTPDLIRLSIGLEHPDDLIEALDRALAGV